MKQLLFYVSLLFTLAVLASPIRHQVPIKDYTTGSLCTKDDKDFREYRYKEQIPYCERNVSTKTKTEIYDAYQIPLNERGDYTIDHFIPLSIGGTNHKDNLWAEHKSIKASRGDFELQTYLKLSRGEITQAEAIEAVLNEKWKCFR